MQTPTVVNYKSTNNIVEANQWLRELPSVIACDFEVASCYTDDQKADFQLELDALEDQNSLYSHTLRQKIASDGLSHPSLSVITHISIAWSETDALVIITDTPRLRARIFEFLVTTPSTQIWHNLGFDAKLITYNTGGRFPQNFEDSQILAKTILNHVDNFKSKTGLKELMGYKYSAWGVAPDYFNLSQMYNEDLLLYAATDACATMALWNEIQTHIKDQT